MAMPSPTSTDSREKDSMADDPPSPSFTASPESSPPPTGEEASRACVPQRPQLPPQFPSAPTMRGMTASSTPLGTLNAARRPPPQSTFSGRGADIPQDLKERMKQFHIGRQGAPPVPTLRTSMSTSSTPPTSSPASPRPNLGGIPSNFRAPAAAGRPPPPLNLNSAPAVPQAPGLKPSLAQKRGMAFPGGLPGAQTSLAGPAARKRPTGMTLSQMNGGSNGGQKGDVSGKAANGGSLLDKYSDFIDKETGSLRFKGKAILTNQGVEFSSGRTFSISLDEVDTLDELGKGNYGTVYKVRHSRPRIRRPGQGLAGNKALPSQIPLSTSSITTLSLESLQDDHLTSPNIAAGTTGVIMAMKEIRLELDDAKFAAIIMELDILHRCISPFIVDFYGAFFQEGAVYICMEFMDGGSIDKLYGDGIPEGVLRKITLSTVMGLKSLKDDHNIIHRDVKPTNILVNTRGQVKICDFGVSGNLVASIAKTNIGCQSYMAPERISSGGVAQAGANPAGGTYSVQSDIWSLGLSIIECALGQYPYPPETYDNIFSQLSAIVDGEPPDLPSAHFSDAARDFVRGCLMKIPKLRPTYAMLLQHAWLAPLLKPPTISEDDEEAAEAAAAAGRDIKTVDLGLGKGEGIGGVPGVGDATTEDREVADWAIAAIERRKTGGAGKKAKPALHAAPLDAVADASPAKKGEVRGEGTAPKEEPVGNGA